MAFGPPEYARSPLAGMDFSWLAVDRDGHVAWLVTFGSAVVPPWVEADAGAFDQVEGWLRALPRRGRGDAPEASSSVREWLDAARRGIFGYDWQAYTGPYALVARPENPVDVGDLPPPLVEVALRTRFGHLCFGDSPALEVADVVACVAPDRRPG